MTEALLRIEAAPVERDEDGMWTHPAWPASDDEYIPMSWFKDHGLEVATREMHDDGEEEFVDQYLEKGLVDCTPWEPSVPAGEGWFIFSIHDIEDGPVCVWVRQVQS